MDTTVHCYLRQFICVMILVYTALGNPGPSTAAPDLDAMISALVYDFSLFHQRLRQHNRTWGNLKMVVWYFEDGSVGL